MILCGGEGWGGVDLAEDKPRLSSQGQTQVLTQREDRRILLSAFRRQIIWPVCWPSPCSDLQAPGPLPQSLLPRPAADMLSRSGSQGRRCLATLSQ